MLIVNFAFCPMYEQRNYRERVTDKNLLSFQVTDKETDLFIRADKDLSAQAKDLVKEYRRQIEDYLRKDSKFLTALEPYEVGSTALPIVKEMARAAKIAGVGPMAAVAGIIAECVGKGLLAFSKEVIVENGGDIYISSKRKRNLGIYAGRSPYTEKLAIEINPGDTPLVIATSSGTVGHSLSFGRADAAIVISSSGALSDASATRLGNLVTSPQDVNEALDKIKKISGVRGAVVIIGKTIGVWGKIKLLRRK